MQQFLQRELLTNKLFDQESSNKKKDLSKVEIRKKQHSQASYTSSKKKLSEIHDNLIELQQKFTNFENTLKQIKVNGSGGFRISSPRQYLNSTNRDCNKHQVPRIEKLGMSTSNKKQKIRIDNKIYECKNIPTSYFQNIDVLFQNQNKRNRTAYKKPKIQKHISIISEENKNNEDDPSFRFQFNALKSCDYPRQAQPHQNVSCQFGKAKSIENRSASKKCKVNGKCANKQPLQYLYILSPRDSHKANNIHNNPSYPFSEARTKQLRECKRMMNNNFKVYKYCNCCSFHQSASPSPTKRDSQGQNQVVNRFRCTRTSQSNHQDQLKLYQNEDISKFQSEHGDQIDRSAENLTPTYRNQIERSKILVNNLRQDSARTKKIKINKKSQQKQNKAEIEKQRVEIQGIKFKKNKKETVPYQENQDSKIKSERENSNQNSNQNYKQFVRSSRQHTKRVYKLGNNLCTAKFGNFKDSREKDSVSYSKKKYVGEDKMVSKQGQKDFRQMTINNFYAGGKNKEKVIDARRVQSSKFARKENNAHKQTKMKEKSRIECVQQMPKKNKKQQQPQRKQNCHSIYHQQSPDSYQLDIKKHTEQHSQQKSSELSKCSKSQPISQKKHHQHHKTNSDLTSMDKRYLLHKSPEKDTSKLYRIEQIIRQQISTEVNARKSQTNNQVFINDQPEAKIYISPMKNQQKNFTNRLHQNNQAGNNCWNRSSDQGKQISSIQCGLSHENSILVNNRQLDIIGAEIRAQQFEEGSKIKTKANCCVNIQTQTQYEKKDQQTSFSVIQTNKNLSRPKQNKENEQIELFQQQKLPQDSGSLNKRQQNNEQSQQKISINSNSIIEKQQNYCSNNEIINENNKEQIITGNLQCQSNNEVNNQLQNTSKISEKIENTTQIQYQMIINQHFNIMSQHVCLVIANNQVQNSVEITDEEQFKQQNEEVYYQIYVNRVNSANEQQKVDQIIQTKSQSIRQDLNIANQVNIRNKRQVNYQEVSKQIQNSQIQSPRHNQSIFTSPGLEAYQTSQLNKQGIELCEEAQDLLDFQSDQDDAKQKDQKGQKEQQQNKGSQQEDQQNKNNINDPLKFQIEQQEQNEEQVSLLGDISELDEQSEHKIVLNVNSVTPKQNNLLIVNDECNDTLLISFRKKDQMHSSNPNSDMIINSKQQKDRTKKNNEQFISIPQKQNEQNVVRKTSTFLELELENNNIQGDNLIRPSMEQQKILKSEPEGKEQANQKPKQQKKAPRISKKQRPSMKKQNNSRIQNALATMDKQSNNASDKRSETIHLLSEESGLSIDILGLKQKKSVSSIPSSVNLVLKYAESQGYFDLGSASHSEVNKKEKNGTTSVNTIEKKDPSADFIGYTNSQVLIGNRDNVVQDTQHFLSDDGQSTVRGYQEQSLTQMRQNLSDSEIKVRNKENKNKKQQQQQKNRKQKKRKVSTVSTNQKKQVSGKGKKQKQQKESGIIEKRKQKVDKVEIGIQWVDRLLDYSSESMKGKTQTNKMNEAKQGQTNTLTAQYPLNIDSPVKQPQHQSTTNSQPQQHPPITHTDNMTQAHKMQEEHDENVRCGQRRKQLKLCSKTIEINEKIKQNAFHQLFSMSFTARSSTTSNNQQNIFMQSHVQQCFNLKDKYARCKKITEKSQENLELDQQKRVNCQIKNNRISTKKQHKILSTSQSKYKISKTNSLIHAPILPLIQTKNQQQFPISDHISISTDKQKLIIVDQHHKIVQQIFSKINYSYTDLINRLFTPTYPTFWFNSSNFNLYQYSPQILTHQYQHFNHLFIQKYTKIDQFVDFRTYVEALTGCPMLKLENNKWNKVKNMRKHNAIFGFCLDPAGDVYRILGAEEFRESKISRISAESEGLGVKFVKLRKPNGKCINVGWQKFLNCYKNPFLLGFNPQYFIRSITISPPISAPPPKYHIIDIKFPCKPSRIPPTSRIHCILSLSSQKSKITVYNEFSENKYENIGTGDGSFISMYLKPSQFNYMLVVMGCQYNSVLRICCSQYVEIGCCRWADDGNEGVICGVGEDLVMCDAV